MQNVVINAESVCACIKLDLEIKMKMKVDIQYHSCYKK